ncbi:MAG TPA: uroporphyrinogen decarboxylase [Deinococcales bacterium]|nr:uroporphyrinogen decarboxylase [Deinococcales bacterium]
MTLAAPRPTTEPLFLRVLRGEDSPRAPIWIMRQAGRYLPEYMAVKAKADFLTMCRTPELAAEVTLQPIRRLGVDAAIIFNDIMTPLPAAGIHVDFNPGPVVAEPIRDAAGVRRLRLPEQDEIAPFLEEAIRIVRRELAPKGVPVIGFAGAPLTMATYLVQGGGSKEFELLRAFLRVEPKVAHDLLERLTDLTVSYLRAQVAAGAQAVQLFDSWAGLHDARSYREFALPYNARVLEAVSDLGVPRIYLAIGAGHLLPEVASLPCEAVSLDWRLPLSTARALLPGKTLQGNLDPTVLLATPEVITREAENVLREGLGGPHVFNLGHGILRQTPPEHAEHLVRVVQAFERPVAAQAAQGRTQ